MAPPKRRRLLIRGAQLVTPEGVREGDCLIEDGRIGAVGEVGPVPQAEVLDGEGRYLVPGFLDLHVHGGGGAEFAEGDPDAARAIVDFHLRHGTTGLLATILPGPLGRMRRAMAAACGIPGVLGIHLEGPFLNPERAGALDPAWFLPPSRDAFRKLVSGFESAIKIVTFAPELPGAIELLTEIRAIGAVPAIGHTAAPYEKAEAAFGRGVGHVVHLGNAMTGLHHRDPGCVGAALLSGASLELICDGVHIHPAFVRLVVEFLRGRGELQRLCLVSDATAAAGRPDGNYSLGGRAVRLQGGEVRLLDGTLAGSALTLDQALRNVVRFADLQVPEALPLVTANPAWVLRGAPTYGALAVGSRADLVLLSPELGVEGVLWEGKAVPSAPLLG